GDEGRGHGSSPQSPAIRRRPGRKSPPGKVSGGEAPRRMEGVIDGHGDHRGHGVNRSTGTVVIHDETPPCRVRFRRTVELYQPASGAVNVCRDAGAAWRPVRKVVCGARTLL